MLIETVGLAERISKLVFFVVVWLMWALAHMSSAYAVFLSIRDYNVEFEYAAVNISSATLVMGFLLAIDLAIILTRDD